MFNKTMFLLIITVIEIDFCFSQAHFSYTSNTGNNATIAIPISANPRINDIPISAGDEIGVFTPGGLCVGAIVWNNINIAITVWGDDPQTPEIDGIVPGEEMKFRIWQHTTGSEFDSVFVTYSLGNGIYSVDGIYALSDITAYPSGVSSIHSNSHNPPDNYLISAKVFPNPFNDATVYQIETDISASINIIIFDLLGRELIRMNNQVIYEGKNDFHISMENLPSGIYLLSLQVIEISNYKDKYQHNKKMLINKLVLLK